MACSHVFTTRADLDCPEEQALLGIYFVTQSAPDVKKKKHPTKSHHGTSNLYELSQLLNVVFKVYNNRDKAKEVKVDPRINISKCNY